MTRVGGIASEALKSYIERIERLEEEKKALADDIKDIYAEAKSTGFDTKVLRQVIKRRKMEEHERDEQDSLRDLYEHAVMHPTPIEKHIENQKITLVTG